MKKKEVTNEMLAEHMTSLTATVSGLALKIDAVEARLTKKIDIDIENLAIIVVGGFDDMYKRLDTHDKKFDRIDRRFDALDSRFDSIDLRFKKVEGRVDVLEV